eukprot:3754150-Pleurochrysis_carterae.AAC.1
MARGCCKRKGQIDQVRAKITRTRAHGSALVRVCSTESASQVHGRTDRPRTDQWTRPRGWQANDTD